MKTHFFSKQEHTIVQSIVMNFWNLNSLSKVKMKLLYYAL